MANLLAIPTGEVLAIDLGMASIGDLPLQGTWETLSPNGWPVDRATPASDVFALGVLCLRLLGRLPGVGSPPARNGPRPFLRKGCLPWPPTCPLWRVPST